MAFNLETARAQVGLAVTDVSKDLLLTMGMNAALAIAENYCDRYFVWKKDVVTFINPPGPRLQLKRYPITYVEYAGGLDGASEIDKDAYSVHHIHGYLSFGSHRSLHHFQHTLFPWWHGRDFKVIFEGGYKWDEFPADLELALWGIFNAVWAALNMTTTGAAQGLPGPITSVSVPDVGTVSFGENKTTVRSVVQGADGFGQYGAFFHLLDSYRDLSC